ncbi:hypothetical protein DOTSEDRAFT_70615 [Dothistroma septosporum NZE10]|uniref:Uncharacterized protein n=1 Tax=Dothistroma septosporum (strain NZE10 / CBS 128990) TaxID=675120 RepID=N1PUN8_DOTSN|nr:hypothetical protein DOTSEDRAFT_70615 [Dothistroma septosporum NZE10]
MMVPLTAIVTLASLVGSAAADHIYRGPFRGPYGQLPQPRQYPSGAPFPLSSGSRSTLPSGHLPLPDSSSSSTFTSNVAPSAVRPAPAAAVPTSISRPGNPTPPALTTPYSTAPEHTFDSVCNGTSAPFQHAPTGTALQTRQSELHRPTWKDTTPMIPPSGRLQPTRNGTAPRTYHSEHPGPSQNSTCSGATVNVLDASLDWWYSKTYTQIESTFLVQFGDNATATGWTLLPAETTFDVTSAVADPTCTSSTAFNAVANETQLSYSCWDTPTPIAAATTTVEQTAFKSINATSSTGSVPNIVTTPTPAALTIGKSNETVAAGTPVVHFSKYEVVSKRSSRRYDGRVECIERTTTHRLNQTHSFEYKGRNLDTPAATDNGVFGKLQFAFLQAVGQATATPGTWVAVPTVVVVLKKIAAAQAVLGKGVQGPESALQTITPTLPSGLSTLRTTPTDAGTFWMPLSPSIEVSASALDVPTRVAEAITTPVPNYDVHTTDGGRLVDVPFVAHLEHSDVTLNVPVNPTKPHSVVTAVWGGKTVTASALTNDMSPAGDNIGRLLSAVMGAASPTNALEVLEQAQQTAGRGNHEGSSDSTASAIAAIIGAVPGVIANVGIDGTVGSMGGQVRPSGETSDGTNDGHAQEETAQSDGGSATGSQGGGGSSGHGFAGSGSVGQSGEHNDIGHSSDTQSAGPDHVEAGQGSKGGQATAFQGSGSASNGNSKPVFNIGGAMVTGTIIGGPTPIAIVLGGQTAVAGESAITINGNRVILLQGAAAVVVDGATTRIAALTANLGALVNIPLVTIGEVIFTANAATQYNIGGSTLTPGGRIVVSGTTINLAADAAQVIVNSQTRNLSPPIITPAPFLTFDGTVYKANQGSTYNVGGQFLTPGGAILVSGSSISLSPGGADVLINGVVQPSSGAAGHGTGLDTITAPPVLTVDGQAYSPNGGTSYVVSGQTLTPGGVLTFDGPAGSETVSLNSNANELVVITKGVTATSMIKLIGAAASGAPELTIDDKTYTALAYSIGSGAKYIVAGQILTPGGSVILTNVDGAPTISLEPAGTALVTISDGTTSTSQIAGAYAVLPTNAPILTIGEESFTAINNGATYNIHGDTLTPGGTDTVVINSRTYVVTLSPYATLLEIRTIGPDGRTTSTSFETLFPATMTRSTIHNTDTGNSLAATAGASRTSGSTSPTGSSTIDIANRGSCSMAFELTATIIVLSSLVLAIWL